MTPHRVNLKAKPRQHQHKEHSAKLIDIHSKITIFLGNMDEAGTSSKYEVKYLEGNDRCRKQSDRLMALNPLVRYLVSSTYEVKFFATIY